MRCGAGSNVTTTKGRINVRAVQAEMLLSVTGAQFEREASWAAYCQAEERAKMLVEVWLAGYL